MMVLMMILTLHNSDKGLGRDEILLRMAIEERMSNCSPVDSGTYATCRIFVRNFRRHSAIAFVSCSGSFVQIVDRDVHDGVDDDSAALQCRKRAWEGEMQFFSKGRGPGQRQIASTLLTLVRLLRG